MCVCARLPRTFGSRLIMRPVRNGAAPSPFLSSIGLANLFGLYESCLVSLMAPEHLNVFNDVITGVEVPPSRSAGATLTLTRFLSTTSLTSAQCPSRVIFATRETYSATPCFDRFDVLLDLCSTPSHSPQRVRNSESYGNDPGRFITHSAEPKSILETPNG